jgi:hypothetical protein
MPKVFFDLFIMTKKKGKAQTAVIAASQDSAAGLEQNAAITKGSPDAQSPTGKIKASELSASALVICRNK